MPLRRGQDSRISERSWQRCHTDTGRNVSFTAYITLHWSPFVKCSVCGKPKVRFMYSSYQTKHNFILHNLINSPSRDMTAFQPNVFFKNALITGHKYLTDFSLRHPAKVKILLLSNKHCVAEYTVCSFACHLFTSCNYGQQRRRQLRKKWKEKYSLVIPD